MGMIGIGVGVPFGGGGGIPSISSPKDIADLVAWYDATQITGVADGGALDTWPDESGNGYDLTLESGATAPTYYNSTAGKLINGKAAVWWTGGEAVNEGLYSAAAALIATTGSRTVFVAFNDAVASPGASGVDALWAMKQAGSGNDGSAVNAWNTFNVTGLAVFNDSTGSTGDTLYLNGATSPLTYSVNAAQQAALVTQTVPGTNGGQFVLGNYIPVINAD